MTDSKALRDLIASRGMKLKFVAESLGLSQYGFQLKVDNVNEFKISEVARLCKLLKVESLEERERIFFAKKDGAKSSIA